MLSTSLGLVRYQNLLTRKLGALIGWFSIMLN